MGQDCGDIQVSHHATAQNKSLQTDCPNNKQAFSHAHPCRITDYTPDLNRSDVDAIIAKALKLYSDVIPLDFQQIDSGTADIMIMFKGQGNALLVLLMRKMFDLVLTLLLSYQNQTMGILLHSMGRVGSWLMHSPLGRAMEVTPILMKMKTGLKPQQVLMLRKYDQGDIILQLITFPL